MGAGIGVWICGSGSVGVRWFLSKFFMLEFVDEVGLDTCQDAGFTQKNYR